MAGLEFIGYCELAGRALGSLPIKRLVENKSDVLAS